MARLFYDLETSGIDTKHQILTACFIITNDKFEIDEVLNFRVALNPLEIPAESAISVNAVDITQHMLHHSNRFPDLITEEEFAEKVNNLLENFLGNFDPLIGYNSNKFDIKHLRKVLIKWGYNPYYARNQFPMVDIYNHIKFLRLSKPKEFSDILDLKLGTIYARLIGKDARVLHEAEADVHHCIDVSKFLLENFDWDIVKENHKVNNLFAMMLIPGDVLMVANPHFDGPPFSKCIVHDANDSYILLEKTKLENLDENKFSLVHKNDFKIGKKISEVELSNPMSVQKYFDSFEDKKGVENFIYHLKFKDFNELKDIREYPDSYAIGPTFSHLGEMMNSQTFTRSRPIKHTDEGLEIDDFTDGEKWYIISHFKTYGLGEDDVFDGEKNEEKVKLLKEYKAAYKELFESLK